MRTIKLVSKPNEDYDKPNRITNMSYFEICLIIMCALLSILIIMLIMKSSIQKHTQHTLNQHNDMLTQYLQLNKEQQNQALHQLLDQVYKQLGAVRSDVNQRLNDGFEKTDHIFNDVIKRLTLLDSAQKDMKLLTNDIVSLHQLFNDKRARGAFGEMQLENLLANILPSAHFSLQATLNNGKRVDCIIHLPEPHGVIPIDSKFPLENYQLAKNSPPEESKIHWNEFKSNLKQHIDAVASKYIHPPQTTEYAILFLPAESLFSDTVNYFPHLLEYAYQQKVWISSPSTILAIMHSAQIVIKDHNTREQIDLIQNHLQALGKDFTLYSQRISRFLQHIRATHKDVDQIEIKQQTS